MKIGFDFRMGGAINSGIGRYSFELVKELLKRYKEHEFVIFYNELNCDFDDISQLKKLGASLVKANFRHYSLSEQINLPRLLQKNECDLIHFPNFNVPIMYKGKYVVTIHDVVHHSVGGHKKARYHKFLAYKYVIKSAAKNSSAIITVTESSKKNISQTLLIDPAKIKVAHLAPAPLLPDANPDLAKQTFMIVKPYVLFVGTLEKKKNILSLARGFEKFIEKYKLDMQLVISGKDDAHYPDLRNEVMKLSCRDKIIFTGFVDDKTQSGLYAGAKVFATASLREGFGLPGLEAMQYGVPVLAADCDVLNEVYDNAALYFDPSNAGQFADHLNLLAVDSQFYTQMREKALQRVKNFSWEKTADLTMQVYLYTMRGQGSILDQNLASNKRKSFEPEPE